MKMYIFSLSDIKPDMFKTDMFWVAKMILSLLNYPDDDVNFW